MLVSAIQQHESVICIHISPSSWVSLPPPPSYPYRSTQSTELSSLCYIAHLHSLAILHIVMYVCTCVYMWTSLVAQMVKRLRTVQETQVQSLYRDDLLERGMAIHSSILAWEILWAEEPDGLQSKGPQTVRHDWAANTFTPSDPHKGLVISSPEASRALFRPKLDCDACQHVQISH